MSFFSRLRARLTGHSRNRRTRRREPRSPFFAQAAQVETLEQRCLLSGLVVTSAADSGPGSLRAEIAAAHDGDTITFDPHIFDFNPTDHTIKLDSDELEIHTNLTIQGPGATNLAISGGNQFRVFEVGERCTVTLQGLTIENGTGITAPSSSIYQFDGIGGAVINFGTLTVSGCTVSGSTASAASAYGGGIFNADEGTLVVTGSTFSGDSAARGGGIFNVGTATITGSTLSGDSATRGGAIYNNGVMVLTNDIVTDNRAYSGGGIYNLRAMTLTNDEVTNNTATDSGGGIFNETTGTLLLISSDVSGNQQAHGKDIYNVGKVTKNKK